MHPTLATLMVAHDALESGDAELRLRLLDELVDCERTRHTFGFLWSRPVSRNHWDRTSLKYLVDGKAHWSGWRNALPGRSVLAPIGAPANKFWVPMPVAFDENCCVVPARTERPAGNTLDWPDANGVVRVELFRDVAELVEIWQTSHVDADLSVASGFTPVDPGQSRSSQSGEEQS